MFDKIIVLDFGSQYNMLICRRIREMNVYSELKPYDIKAEEIMKISNLKGIIFSGGPSSVYDDEAFKIDKKIYDLGIPILGICYGMQLIAFDLGGNVLPSSKKEYGKTSISVNTNCDIFNDTPSIQNVWMSHSDFVERLPIGFTNIASSETCINVACFNPSKNIYTLQFHPEVNNTKYGNKILSNFVFKVCHANNNWSMKDYINVKVNQIKDDVKNEKVLLGLSGGVDSSVAALLINKAINNNLTCMFIDHGLLRKNEASSVMKMFKEKMNINVILIDAKSRFLNKLKNITDPEQKRKIIGQEFVDVFREESEKLGQFTYLAQGTLYTDVIESGTKTAQTIKSHHNVGGLPKDLKFKIIEPLNCLFKDEVRVLGKELGLDDEIVNRQPFPGPGLGIRIIGKITEEKIRLVQESDFILREEIKKAGLDKSIWQYFTCLPSVKTVGVKGDKRDYSDMILIRAVTSVDGMTSDWARIDYDILDKISRRITNEIKGINRVLYDVTSKPPATIEYE